MTKIAVVSDLHIDNSLWNYHLMLDVVSFLKGKSFDLVLLLGDIAKTLKDIEYVFQCFEGIGEKVAFIPGNHDIEIERHQGYLISSTEKLQFYLPKLAESYNIAFLENQSISVSGLKILGAMGWFDYSFLNMSGTKRQLNTLRELSLKKNEHLYFENVMCSDPIEWNLIVHDHQFQKFNEVLNQQYQYDGDLMYGLHYVPFIQSLDIYKDCPDRLDIAFEGSSKYGQAIVAHKGVSKKIVVHGHAHNNQLKKNIQEVTLISKVLGGEEDRPYQSTKKELRNAITVLQME